MRIAVLGLGVIGTTYAYALQNAGVDTYHIVIAGIVMKKLFAGNELTSRIMTLHNDVNDIMYGCRCVYDEGKSHGLELPLFYGNMDRVFAKIK